MEDTLRRQRDAAVQGLGMAEAQRRIWWLHAADIALPPIRCASAPSPRPFVNGHSGPSPCALLLRDRHLPAPSPSCPVAMATRVQSIDPPARCRSCLIFIESAVLWCSSNGSSGGSSGGGATRRPHVAGPRYTRGSDACWAAFGSCRSRSAACQQRAAAVSGSKSAPSAGPAPLAGPAPSAGVSRRRRCQCAAAARATIRPGGRGAWGGMVGWAAGVVRGAHAAGSRYGAMPGGVFGRSVGSRARSHACTARTAVCAACAQGVTRSCDALARARLNNVQS